MVTDKERLQDVEEMIKLGGHIKELYKLIDQIHLMIKSQNELIKILDIRIKRLEDN